MAVCACGSVCTSTLPPEGNIPNCISVGQWESFLLKALLHFPNSLQLAHVTVVMGGHGISFVLKDGTESGHYFKAALAPPLGSHPWPCGPRLSYLHPLVLLGDPFTQLLASGP